MGSILSFATVQTTISHINYWDEVNSWNNLWKFWNGPPCRNKSGSFPLFNIAAYWQSSNTEGCGKKLSQIHANNIDHGEMGIGLRIYVRYCLKNECKIKGGLERSEIFFRLNLLFMMSGIFQMVLWLIGSLLDLFDPHKN